MITVSHDEKKARRQARLAAQFATAPGRKPDNVRIATPRDVEPILELMIEAHSEVGMSPLNKEKVCRRIITAVERDKAIAGVIDGPNGIEASVGLMLAQWWYSDEFHIEDVWNFVAPAHRASRHAQNLLNFSKWFADEIQIPLLMGILTTEKTLEKERLYERRLPKVGALFMYRPQPKVVTDV